MNLRKRMCCSFLRRQNPAPARKPEKIEQALDLVWVIYNFGRRHSSLRFGRVMRTPAMQAGLLSSPLTIGEIFLWIPPPSALDRWRLGQRLQKGRR